MTQTMPDQERSARRHWQLPGVRLRVAVGLSVLVGVMLVLAVWATVQPVMTSSPLAARIVFLLLAVAGVPCCVAAWRLRRIEIALEPDGVRIGHILGNRLTGWAEIRGAEVREGVFGSRVVLLGEDGHLDDTVVNPVFEERAAEVVAAINARTCEQP
ncbi:hypothetical protein DT076_13020 [Desertihabitans brevis]|uniref:PH domain-containing protein n=1 Tax=Desertihabitans brevis TaxID=2268447 RepID=A0A367YWA8_9ACTN|nr:hypothetical protein [Desertihabitans brevis]RCK69241.1 hypothetical protein DT076_13020 [Desertihabitans brevis]